ncbi:hypothetical protein BZL30_4079 [Mycobacterium kansasii]|uniref:Uncharacterized protein n=1 Tax=Mycobacterium kansasii TaxID=1768 RepID=A0A1V3X8P2_MYCKA|nr:hypothetical protein BZL30_4079 [Mycobacterium kansasii]
MSSQLDLQVVSAILNAHLTAVEGRDALNQLQQETEAAVRTRSDLDTPAGARDFQRFLIGKLRDIREVVANASLDDTSKATLMAAWTSLYNASKNEAGRSGRAGDAARAAGDGGGQLADLLSDDPLLDSLLFDDPALPDGEAPMPAAVPRRRRWRRRRPAYPTSAAYLCRGYRQGQPRRCPASVGAGLPFRDCSGDLNRGSPTATNANWIPAIPTTSEPATLMTPQKTGKTGETPTRNHHRTSRTRHRPVRRPSRCPTVRRSPPPTPNWQRPSRPQPAECRSQMRSNSRELPCRRRARRSPTR